MSFIRKIKRNGRVYLAEVENYRDGAKVKQRHIRYLGLDPESNENNFQLYARDLTVDSVKVHGPIIVLESLARELGLFEILGDIAHPILTLTFAHCMNYKSVAETEKWFRKTDLASVFGCDEITENQLYDSIASFSKYDYEYLEKSIFEKLTQIFGEDESGVIYDGTNTYLSGSRSDLAKMGKCKEGVKGRKLIQIGLGVTKTLGLPIFHQVHAGNIHDTKMFNEAILRFSSRGTRQGLAVFDRGITSENCVSKLEQMGWKCLAGLPMHKGVKAAISNLDFDNMKSFRNFVLQGDTKFFVKGIPFKIGKTNGKLIILQNYLKKQRQTVERMMLIEDAKRFLDTNPLEIPDKIMKCFTPSGRVNRHAVQRAERYDGLSFIFTNAKLPLKKAVQYYFAKDLIERCFRLSKSVLNLNPIRLQLDKNIQSHIMICYLGLTLLTTVRLRLENKGIFRDPGEVLRSLDSIFKVYMTGENPKTKLRMPFHKVNTLSNHQTGIIKIIAPNLEM
jgi:hypothetical protein